MNTFTKRGLPRSLAQDAWWLAAPAEAVRGAGVRASTPITRQLSLPILGIVALIIGLDFTFWHGVGALPLTILMAIYALVLAYVFQVGRDTAAKMLAVGALACLPILAFVQWLSVLWYIAGLFAVLAISVGAQRRQSWALFWRLPWAGCVGLFRELGQVDTTAQSGRFQQFLRDWGLGLGVGLVFALLFLIANPMLDQLADAIHALLAQFELELARVILWMFSAMAAMMVVAAKFITLPAPKPTKEAVFFKPQSLINALLVFNLLFAFQLGSDVWVLMFQGWLPGDITLAEYVHRGAYPLVVTALLAGFFMLLARPHVASSQLLKWALLIWVVQNAALLGFAAYRLSIYMDDFGLTYLRVHSVLWMGLVAVGLCLVAWDIVRPQRQGWVVAWSWRSAAFVLYAACFVNFGAIITNANIARADVGKTVDWYYLCGIGVSNHAVLYENWDDYDIPFSKSALGYRPIKNWRDWDFRRQGIDRNISHIETRYSGIPS